MLRTSDRVQRQVLAPPAGFASLGESLRSADSNVVQHPFVERLQDTAFTPPSCGSMKPGKHSTRNASPHIVEGLGRQVR